MITTWLFIVLFFNFIPVLHSQKMMDIYIYSNSSFKNQIYNKEKFIHYFVCSLFKSASFPFANEMSFE